MAAKTVTVKSSGGDYTTLNAALVGESADLVTNTRLLTIECYASAGNDTTAASTGTGYTTNASYYIKITCPAGERHAGVFDTNKYYMSLSTGNGISVTELYTVVEFIQINLTGTGSQTGIGFGAGGYFIARHNLVKKTGGGGSTNYGISVNGTYTDAWVYGNFVYNISGASAIGIDQAKSTAGANVKFYNNTIYNVVNGMRSNYADSVIAINNLIVGTTNPAVGTYGAGTDYNATDDAAIGYTVTGGGNTHDVVNVDADPITDLFVSATDLHLASTASQVINAGSDLGASYNTDIDGVARTGTWDIGADEYVAAGGSAHPYTGGVGDGAITQSAATQRIRGIVRELGGAQAYSSGTVKARGKVPAVGGDFSFSAATVKARGRVPTVGGSVAFSAESIYSKATLYLYASGASQAYSAESVKARGKSPIIGGPIIYAAASEYSKFSAPGTNYAYVGDGVLVFGNGSEHAIGRVYESGGAFHFAAGSVYVKTAGSNAYSYTGLASGAIVYTGATVIIYTRNRVHEDKPGVRTTASESVPQSTTGQTETKPGARAASHEALPTRPPGQDGFYTGPAQDGFYDEYPVDGFYADIGYFKEFKPFHRATFTKEGKPS